MRKKRKTNVSLGGLRIIANFLSSAFSTWNKHDLISKAIDLFKQIVC